MTIRAMTPEDYPQAYLLWTSDPGVGLRAADDSREGIERYLRRNPATCFVAEAEGRVVGTLLAGHDGRRGYIGHTVVHPDFRRQGVGSALVRAAESAFRREGIRKAALVVFAANETGNAFWEKMGYAVREDLVYRNRDLV